MYLVTCVKKGLYFTLLFGLLISEKELTMFIILIEIWYGTKFIVDP